MPAELLIFLLLGAGVLVLFLYFVPINLWLTALFAGVQLSILELVFMRIRKSPPLAQASACAFQLCSRVLKLNGLYFKQGTCIFIA
ncbi:flotillin-like FloA family protein [Ekhidna sp.]|uniref:flotillin-like FloA family protein n=1 Tax=Ekhidna sp. TaxID=2608089 RepID=UPI003CCBAA7B